MRPFSQNSLSCMLDVSVIITSFDTRKLTLDAINSILTEGSNLSKEIITIDNASSDGSVISLTQLSDKGKIKLIKNTTNLGFAKANNQGLKIAKGKYLFLLNSDTVVKKGVLKRLIVFAERTKSTGVVAPRLINPDGSIQASCFRLPTLTKAVRQYWLGEASLLDKYYPRSSNPSEVESVVMAAFLITSEAYKKVGFLDERYFMYFEDLDYCRRVRNAGLKIYYLPEVEVIHYHGASSKTEKKVDQWRKLIPSSKIYHGFLRHYLFNFILWSGQKWQKLFRKYEEGKKV